MLGLLKKLFGGKPAEQTAEAPYKVETTPVVAEAEPVPAVEAVIVIPEAVVPAAVVEQEPAKKKQSVKKPAAPKTATPRAPRKPKSKPAS